MTNTRGIIKTLHSIYQHLVSTQQLGTDVSLILEVKEMKQRYFREDHSFYSLASDRGSIWTHFCLTLGSVFLTSTLRLLTWNKHLHKIYGEKSGSHTFIQDVKTYSNPDLSLSFAMNGVQKAWSNKVQWLSLWWLRASVHTEEGKQTGLPSDSHLWRRWSQVGGRRQNISGSMWAPWLILVAFNRTCFTLFGLIERKGRGSLELTHPRHPHIDELSSVWLTAPSFSVLADSLRKIGSFFFLFYNILVIHPHTLRALASGEEGSWSEVP